MVFFFLILQNPVILLDYVLVFIVLGQFLRYMVYSFESFYFRDVFFNVLLFVLVL